MMEKKNFILFFLILIILFIATFNITYSKYIFIRSSTIKISSSPFFFEVNKKSDNVIFPRTQDEADFDGILTTDTTFDLIVSNNDGNSFNKYDVTYTISIIDGSKFSFENGNTITKTLKGGSKLNETVTLKLKINDLTDPSNTLKLKIESTKPYSKVINIELKVIQDGAIQTIEDLLDLSLDIRGLDKNGQSKAVTDISTQRFKMTRDLDFEDRSSYDNADRTDYGDVNLNGKEASTLYEELTSETGFLPIGELEHPFKGVFNGDNYTLSNLEIHKSLQKNIGFFGTTDGATIKNVTFKGDILNHNQTAGMVIGKMYGGELNNVTVRGVVTSTDELNAQQDTYSGGLVGYVTAGATITECTNYATVTSQFDGDASNFSGPAGGITAWMAHSNISNCKNYGEIIGQSYVGGIVGFSGMQLDNAGGSSGEGGGTVSQCENHGYVHYYVKSGTLPSNWGKHIGGIAGYNKKAGIVTGNTNCGDAIVLGIQNVGGIVGNNSSGGIVTNNVNKSTNISGNSGVGRIVGGGTQPSSGDGNREDYS